MQQFHVIDIASNEVVAVSSLGKHSYCVLDFWHTNCVKCPAALGKFDSAAQKHKMAGDNQENIVFIACAMSLGDGNKELVADLICDWENLLHVFLPLEEKEAVKSMFDIKSVPFCIVLDKNGHLLAKGDPNTINYTELIKQDIAKNTKTAAPPAIERPAFTLDEDF